MKKLLLFIWVCLSIIFAFDHVFLSCPAAGQPKTIVKPGNRISDFEARLALARVLSYEDSNLEGSLSQYRILLAGHPSDTQVQVETAEVLSRLKKYDEAASILREVLKREPANLNILVTTGNIYRYTGDMETSITYYKMALAVSPRSKEALYGLASALNQTGRADESEKILRGLYDQYPEDASIALELSRSYIAGRKYLMARPILLRTMELSKNDPDTIVLLADIECETGHAKSCRDLYMKALELSGNKESVKLRLADWMNMWGDFYGAESYYREYLASHTGNLPVSLKLASTLASSQRYEESEGIYMRLIFDGNAKAGALTGLARVKLLEKDYEGSIKYAKDALAAEPGNNDAFGIAAQSLVMTGSFSDARDLYQKTAMKGSERSKVMVDTGLTYLKENDIDSARKYFEKAIKEKPDDAAAIFYANWPDRVRTKQFLSSVIGKDKWSAGDLADWAELYMSEGLFGEAILFYRAALERDPEHFRSYIGLAEVLAVDRRYDESISLFKKLSAEFPKNYKILLGMARTLGWSKRYEESVELYRMIISMDPANPVPRREMARTAMWGKMAVLSMETYNSVLSPSVDSKLLDRLKRIDGLTADPTMKDIRDKLGLSAADGSLYTGYEKAGEVIGVDFQPYPGPSIQHEARSAIIDLYPDYRIQKSVYLEKKAKQLSYNKYFASSLPVYEALLNESPGNEEAIFDLAQAQCSMGLCKLEGKTYRRLLHIDPLHGLAADASELQRIRSNPSLRFDYSYWNEEGRGDLARITRNRFDLSFDIPVQCQYHIYMKGHRWLEHPDLTNRTYGANGFSLGFSGVFSPFLKGEASWTHKRYDSGDFATKDTGYGSLWFNVHDIFRFGAGYARTDELYNYFGIDQGIQADRFWAGFHSDITRKLEIDGKAEYINYTDSNSGSFLGMSAGYAFTDHPKIFKVTVSGELRNTLHDNEYVYRNGSLVNIIHPYWAPRDYSAAGLVLEWYHDLSKLFICGGEKHFYDIKASFGTDSENNPYARAEGEWNYEFIKHWMVGIKGMVHTSPEWDATGVWAILRYRF